MLTSFLKMVSLGFMGYLVQILDVLFCYGEDKQDV